MQRKAKLTNSLQTDEKLLKNFPDQYKANFDADGFHVTYLFCFISGTA